ncbi:hypothetical protein Glove_104g69 [Diversispora epigaea]|uniref:Uncharacterized protein n=1 Tax=Diversispora epigaea TaxID=1348612 RepID=A0A397J7K9_9GLOM|nr:hypothetical protein Glove_104g69 [Diversispora epigaea]
MLFKNTDNRATILKIYEKLNKLETDFADMKKGQSGMKTDIKKIKNEICLLTNDKEFIEDIIVSVAEVILKLNLYPSPQEYKESCEAYIQQFHEDVYNSFVLTTCIGRKWNVYYESKIQSKLSDKIRSQRGTLCGKIRTAMYDVFGNQLRPIKSNAKSQEILNWKQLPSTKSCYKKIFDKSDFPGNPTYMEAILKKVWSPTSKPPEQHVAWAILARKIILGPRNYNFGEKNRFCINLKKSKYLKNPKSILGTCIAWAISIVQTILDPTNGNIKISEDTIKYPLSINIEKIKNKETFEIESESESEPENSLPPSSSSPKK